MKGVIDETFTKAHSLPIRISLLREKALKHKQMCCLLPFIYTVIYHEAAYDSIARGARGGSLSPF